MITADTYTDIRDKHDSAALGKAFSSIISGKLLLHCLCSSFMLNVFVAGVQTVGISPHERDLLIRSILCDLAEGDTSSTPPRGTTWTSWDPESLSRHCLPSVFVVSS